MALGLYVGTCVVSGFQEGFQNAARFADSLNWRKFVASFDFVTTYRYIVILHLVFRVEAPFMSDKRCQSLMNQQK